MCGVRAPLRRTMHRRRSSTRLPFASMPSALAPAGTGAVAPSDRTRPTVDLGTVIEAPDGSAVENETGHPRGGRNTAMSVFSTESGLDGEYVVQSLRRHLA